MYLERISVSLSYNKCFLLNSVEHPLTTKVKTVYSSTLAEQIRRQRPDIYSLQSADDRSEFLTSLMNVSAPSMLVIVRISIP